jgi:hypothetical protein
VRLTARQRELLRLTRAAGSCVNLLRAPFAVAWVVSVRSNGRVATFGERTGDQLVKLELLRPDPDPTTRAVRRRDVVVGTRYVLTEAGRVMVARLNHKE